jgi:DNA-directed RNA polymerase specialized sigma24 family protein
MKKHEPPSPQSLAGDRAERQPTPSRPLTGARSAAFANWYENSLEAGLTTARKYVGEDDEQDIVHDAIVAMLDEMRRDVRPTPFPPNEGAFRARFFTKVKDRGIEYRRRGKPAEPSARTKRRKDKREVPAPQSSDRPLWKVFESLDALPMDLVDPEPEPCGFVARCEGHPGLRRYPPLDWVKYDAELVAFVDWLVYYVLPEGQQQAIRDTYFTPTSREDVAKTREEMAQSHGISVKTHDTHHRRALTTLRSAFGGWWPSFDPYDENPWPGIVHAMWMRWLARTVGDGDGDESATDARRAA